MASTAVYQFRMADEKEAFKRQEGRLVLTLESRLQNYLNALNNTRSLLLLHTEPPSAREFDAFVAGMEMEKRFPGIGGIGWAPVVQASQVPAFIKKAQAEGAKDYHI